MQKKDENIVNRKPKPTTKIYYRVTVPDSGTLEAGDVVIKLNGIVARKADAQCQDEKGKSWPCGAAAKAALRRLVRARAVVCDLPDAGEQKSFTARCAVSGTDLSTWLVRQGWAKPNDRPEPALADAAEPRRPNVSASGVEPSSARCREGRIRITVPVFVEINSRVINGHPIANEGCCFTPGGASRLFKSRIFFLYEARLKRA